MNKETLYELALKSFGTVPGVIKEMAERSMPVAKLYIDGVLTMEHSSFSEMEINAIELKISALNHCESCMKGHSFLLKRAGMAEEDVKAIAEGKITYNSRINSLIQAAEYIYHAGGSSFPDFVISYFEREGITETEVLDIIGIMSLKTISNYVNNYLKAVKTVAQG